VEGSLAAPHAYASPHVPQMHAWVACPACLAQEVLLRGSSQAPCLFAARHRAGRCTWTGTARSTFTMWAPSTPPTSTLWTSTTNRSVAGCFLTGPTYKMHALADWCRQGISTKSFGTGKATVQNYLLPARPTVRCVKLIVSL